MKHRAHPLRFARQRGLAAVEFALIAGMFFTLLIGIMEFSRVLFYWNTAAEVTRLAARSAVVCDSGASIIKDQDGKHVADTAGLEHQRGLLADGLRQRSRHGALHLSDSNRERVQRDHRHHDPRDAVAHRHAAVHDHHDTRDMQTSTGGSVCS
jgi:hypothetical protein